MNFEQFLNEKEDYPYTDYKKWKDAVMKMDSKAEFKTGGTEDEIVALPSKGNKSQQLGKWIGTEKSGKGKVFGE